MITGKPSDGTNSNPVSSEAVACAEFAAFGMAMDLRVIIYDVSITQVCAMCNEIKRKGAIIIANRIVFFSGGTGSWEVANRVRNEHGTDGLSLLFTDTLIEDNDLYRFIIETSAEIFGVTGVKVEALLKRASELPLVHTDMESRRLALESLRVDTIAEIPSLLWLSEQRDVWDVFEESNFLGNSRIAPCSAQLKQRMSRRYVKANFSAEDTVLYLGIDWTEEHRTKAPVKNWAPYPVEFPLCDEPYVNKIDIVRNLEALSIEAPLLYAMGFSHNNCGGFCVRAGQGHFANLLEKNRELYLYHENKEREFIDNIGKDVSILKRVRQGVTGRLTLEQLRNDLESSRQQEVDFTDIGGCGCFVDETEVSL